MQKEAIQGLGGLMRRLYGDDVSNVTGLLLPQIYTGNSWVLLDEESKSVLQELLWGSALRWDLFQVRNGYLAIFDFAQIMEYINHAVGGNFLGPRDYLDIQRRQAQAVVDLNAYLAGVDAARLGIYNNSDALHVVVGDGIYRSFPVDIETVLAVAKANDFTNFISNAYRLGKERLLNSLYLDNSGHCLLLELKK